MVWSSVSAIPLQQAAVHATPLVDVKLCELILFPKFLLV